MSSPHSEAARLSVEIALVNPSLLQALWPTFVTLASTAERAIVIAILVNTASKAVLPAAVGGLPMLHSATAVLAVALVGGATVALLTLG